MKIMTDTDKWNDSWFRKLPANAKLLYLYLADRSDQAGVWEPDWELVEFHTGIDKPAALMKHLNEKVEMLPNDKYWIKNYVIFQNSRGISRRARVHRAIFQSLEKNGIDADCYDQRVLSLESEAEEELDGMSETFTMVRDRWHEICCDLPAINSVTDKRKRLIKSALAEKIVFAILFQKVADSPFLMGKETKWRASFDWVLKPENRIKIMEGNYDSKARRGTTGVEHGRGF